MHPDEIYQLLRNFTSPVVALTSQRGDKPNGMILDSAVRASIVPTIPRLSVYIHKFNFSHDIVYETGQFVLHLLRTDQYDLIHQLGFVSGRTADKLAAIPHRPGTIGVPILEDCYAYFECRVINRMDTGSSTCYLADVVDVGRGTRDAGEVMTAAYFRAHLPPEWKGDYERLLKAAQAYAAEHSRIIRTP